MTARQDRQAYIGIATAEGENNANEWMSDCEILAPHIDAREQWADALGEDSHEADEGLINALGYDGAAKLFGVAPKSAEFWDACKYYNKAWLDTVRAALK